MTRAARITKRLVDALTPGATAHFVWDGELHRFGVKVTPSGSKVYLVQYRAGGRVWRVTIGRHGSPWTPETARARARQLLGHVDTGANPALDRREARDAETVTALVDRFLTEHVDAKRRPSTAREYRRLLAAHVRPAPFGTLRVPDVTAPDVATLHHRLRGTPFMANRVLAVLGKMFALAERWRLRPPGNNPARGIEKYAEAKRQRFLTPDELVRLGAALTAAENEKSISTFAAAAIRLLALTGARRNEILTLEWAHVDRDRALLALPTSKTGAKTVHLNAPALAVLDALPRIGGNPYVIASPRGESHITDLKLPWSRVVAAADLEGVRVHDLRHSFASVGVAAGLGLPIIGKLLGHSQASTTQRYAHVGHDPAKVGNELIGATIGAALGGGA